MSKEQDWTWLDELHSHFVRKEMRDGEEVTIYKHIHEYDVERLFACIHTLRDGLEFYANEPNIVFHPEGLLEEDRKGQAQWIGYEARETLSKAARGEME